LMEFRRDRRRLTNLVGGIWVFIAEALTVIVAAAVALLVAALVLWIG
jgi:hypothetical protein